MNETTEQAAIKAIADITRMHIEHVVLKIDQITKNQEDAYRAIDDLKHAVHQQRHEIKALIEEVKRMSALLPSDTAMALTAPLLELQTDSKRRRESSAIRRHRVTS